MPSDLRAGTLVLDLGHGTVMELVRIAPGSLLMGGSSEHVDSMPVHKVTISKPFYLGTYEVTQSQWRAVMGNIPQHP